MQLLQQRIAEARTNQRFILLEGFCNSGRLSSREDSLQLRYMDEFFAIEKCIGEVVGIISLQNEKQPTTFEPDMIEQPVFEEVKKPEEKKEGEGDEEGGDEPPAEEGEGEAKAPKWKPTDYKWTVTNGKAKNLPQLFRDYMGNRCNFEEKNWSAYQAISHHDAAVKALDEFCRNIIEEGSMTIYQQVIFNDLD